VVLDAAVGLGQVHFVGCEKPAGGDGAAQPPGGDGAAVLGVLGGGPQPGLLVDGRELGDDLVVLPGEVLAAGGGRHLARDMCVGVKGGAVEAGEADGLLVVADMGVHRIEPIGQNPERLHSGILGTLGRA